MGETESVRTNPDLTEKPSSILYAFVSANIAINALTRTQRAAHNLHAVSPLLDNPQ